MLGMFYNVAFKLLPQGSTHRNKPWSHLFSGYARFQRFNYNDMTKQSILSKKAGAMGCPSEPKELFGIDKTGQRSLEDTLTQHSRQGYFL